MRTNISQSVIMTAIESLINMMRYTTNMLTYACKYTAWVIQSHTTINRKEKLQYKQMIEDNML